MTITIQPLPNPAETMIYQDPAELKQRVKELTGRNIYGRPRVTSDTSDYFRIVGGDVLRLDGQDYFVTGDATEGRFGIDRQPKFWVKYVVDLDSGHKKILKLVFHEHFSTKVGPYLVEARRSPEKEAAVLKAVAGDDRFMQGRVLYDEKGNLLRLIDFVRGKTLYNHILSLDMGHEEYFSMEMPGLMERFLVAADAMAWLESQGLTHGDIRNDHIILERDSGRMVWIDFDYEVDHPAYDLWSLGNILVFILGKGAHTAHGVRTQAACYPGLCEGRSVGPAECLLVNHNQIAALGNLFPYIPEPLARMLDNFTAGIGCSFENIAQFSETLRQAWAESGLGS